MTKSRPIEITFDTSKKVTRLEIITCLNAADKFRQAAVKIVAGNVQTAVGPPAPEIDAPLNPDQL